MAKPTIRSDPRRRQGPPSESGRDGPAIEGRWTALAVIFISFIPFTLNWFAVVPAFGPLMADMHIGLAAISLIVGAFIAGYGLAHIPGGLIAQAYGMKFALLLGLLVESIGAAWSARAPDLHALLLGRFIAGIGGSIYIGSAIGLTTAWFRGRDLATAIGLVTGVAFTVGAAIGVYGWEPLVARIGWRPALLAGAAIGLVAFAFLAFFCPIPDDARAGEVGGGHLDLASLRRVFGNRDLWLLGLAFTGGYGAYFTAAELLPEYAQPHLAMASRQAHELATVLLLAGIPGSFLGGWLSDRLIGVMPAFLGACILESLALVLIPKLGPLGLTTAAAVIGAVAILAFVVWISTPGLYRDCIELADVPTAAGLLLTLVAIGGVIAPTLYGRLATTFGYSAGWTALSIFCLLAALIALAARRPARASQRLNGEPASRGAAP